MLAVKLMAAGTVVPRYVLKLRRFAMSNTAFIPIG
jgi:hypothetical protein